jgi:hypothetical protein
MQLLHQMLNMPLFAASVAPSTCITCTVCPCRSMGLSTGCMGVPATPSWVPTSVMSQQTSECCAKAGVSVALGWPCCCTGLALGTLYEWQWAAAGAPAVIKTQLL